MVPDSEAHRAYGYAGGTRLERRDFICQFLSLFPAVLADGTVVPCDQDFRAGYAYGQIGPDGSFEDIWFGRAAAARRRQMMADPDRFACCSMCPYADRPTNTCTVDHIPLRGRETTAEAADACAS